jgi:hypothetical protein
MKKIICLLLCFAFFAPPFAAYAETAEEPPIPAFSYEEALAMAVKDLSNILSLDESLKLMKEQLDEMRKQLRELQRQAQPDPRTLFMMMQRGIQPEPEPKPTPTEQLRHSIANLERQMETLELNKALIRTGTELSLRHTLVTLANLETDIALMEASVALNEENLRRVTLRHQFGFASDNDQRAAEQALEQARTNLASLLITQTGETQNLNKLLQLPLEQKIIVNWEREFTELPGDINAFIAEQAATAPTLRQRQLNADTKKANRDINNDDDMDTPLQNEYDQAMRELADARFSLEAAIRANSQNLEQLQKRSENLQLDLEKAEDQKRTLEAHLRAGLVTPYEISQVSLSIANAEAAIEKNLNQLWLLQFGFMHPYL